MTVTLNPAVDKTCEMGQIRPGEVNRFRSAFTAAGGKGINVAKVLRQFHLPVMAAGFLGGYTGRMIEQTLVKTGIECRFTRIGGATRTNTNILGGDGCVTELLEPGPNITEKELANFRKEFLFCLEQCELVVFSGSAPEGVPFDIYGQLIEQCRAEGRKAFLDTSGEFLKQGVGARPYFLKPNRQELEALAGRELASVREIEKEALKLVDAGIEKVVVSLGSQGLCYVDRKRSLFEPARRVRAVNTVGCGDSVVASFVMSELAGEEPDIALKKAAALSAANAATRENGSIPMNLYLELL